MGLYYNKIIPDFNMEYDRNKFRSPDLNSAKAEVSKMVQAESVRNAIAQLKSISAAETDNVRSINLVFHGVKEMSEKISAEDIPELISLLDSITYPVSGGEDRAAYFKIHREIFNKISAYTGLELNLGATVWPQDIENMMRRIKTWYQNNPNS